MTHIDVKVAGAKADATKTGPLTRGMVGVPVTFNFNEEWNGLTITAVFKAGRHTIDRPSITDMTMVPWELMLEENDLYVGLFGVNSGGTLVIPTVWAHIGTILPSADPSGDSSTDPSMPVWQDILNRVERLEKSSEIPDSGGSIIVDEDGCLTTTTGGFEIDADGYIIL